jgi:hypothetical protein
VDLILKFLLLRNTVNPLVTGVKCCGHKAYSTWKDALRAYTEKYTNDEVEILYVSGFPSVTENDTPNNEDGGTCVFSLSSSDSSDSDDTGGQITDNEYPDAELEDAIRNFDILSLQTHI